MLMSAVDLPSLKDGIFAIFALSTFDLILAKKQQHNYSYPGQRVESYFFYKLVCYKNQKINPKFLV